ncbi:MAG: type IV secretory system conjugative DNA transfer family protein [Candidatus Magasanikbacteria bacterium]|nr:type IV secretory system conjugative DNA transfer family protein [Candidatus Magasanikbacteria bacterium]
MPPDLAPFSPPEAISFVAALLQNPAVFLLVVVWGIIFALVALLYLLRALLHAKSRAAKAFHKTVLLVRVPKEKKTETEQQRSAEAALNQIREEIAVADTFFSAVAGLKRERGLMKWLKGRNDHLAFELVAKAGKISFYVAVPDKLRGFVEQQIHAQYPHAEITEALDYNLFTPYSYIAGSYLWCKFKSAFPFKTYKKMDSDPLLALLNPLSKIGADEGALIQYVVRPASPRWRSQGVQMIRDIKEGQKFEYVARRGALMRELFKTKKALFPQKRDAAKQTAAAEPYRLTQMEEEMVKGMEEKLSHGGLEITVRVVSSAGSRARAQLNLENIINAFSQYNIYRYGNSFGAALPRRVGTLISNSIYRGFDERHYQVVNTEELASLWHLPLPATETPRINWLTARRAPPPINMGTEGIILGRAVYRGEETVVRMKRADRRKHLYVVGKSGSGKSVFIQNLAVQDIQNGEGVCVVDPHGDFVEYVLQHIPKERVDDVVYFNPADTERPIGLNMLEAATEEQKDFVTQEMVSIFYKLVTDPSMIGPMFEHNMRNVMLTLMADPETPGTIVEIPRMFTDDAFVAKWKKKLRDPVVLAFWEKEMAKTSDFHKSEMLGYLISKVGRFVENVMMRNIIGQSHSGFNLREIMDQRKILLVNLAKGLVGEINSNLLGLIIVSKLQMAALERAALPEEERHDFYLYIDEFQNFITESIATILSEARKYRLNLIMAHQYMKQLEDNKGKTTVRDAVLGNAGTIVAFRIGPEDAEVLQKEFAPVFGSYDLLNIEQYTAYIKLLIDNTASKPFNMMTYPPLAGNKELAAAIKELCRLKYGRPREIVEAEIMERAQLGVAAKSSEVDLSEASL